MSEPKRLQSDDLDDQFFDMPDDYEPDKWPEEDGEGDWDDDGYSATQELQTIH